MTNTEPHEFAQATIRDVLIQTLSDNVSTMKSGSNKVPSIVDEDFNGTQPDYPFITMGIIDDFIPVSFYAGANFFQIDMQIKTVSDKKWDAKGLARQIQQVLTTPEVNYYLGSVGISVKQINAMPFSVDDLSTYKQFTSGLDVVMIINDPPSFVQSKTPPQFDIH